LASLAVDDFASAERYVAGGREAAWQAGLIDGIGLAQQLARQLKLYSGDFAGALAESESAIGSPASEALALTVIATVRIHQGALVVARQHVLRAADLVADLDIRSVHPHVRLAQAQLWAAEGRPADGVAILDGLYRNPHRWVVMIVADPTLVPTLVRLAMDAGVPDRAGGLISLTERLAATNSGAGSLCAAARHARGLVDDDAGLLLEAVSLSNGGPRLLATATAREDAARAVTAGGEIDRAIELYSDALDGYTAAGATHAARRVRSCLRRGGVNRLPAQRRGHPDHGWASLTQSELQVVQLVAEGLTNRAVAGRLFMSRYTVDSHLRHVFVKLDVTSRVALTRLVFDPLAVATG
jgi:DNA-binding CsgD family transcriptional regulator